MWSESEFVDDVQYLKSTINKKKSFGRWLICKIFKSSLCGSVPIMKDLSLLRPQLAMGNK
jgi:hypothetical protein